MLKSKIVLSFLLAFAFTACTGKKEAPKGAPGAPDLNAKANEAVAEALANLSKVPSFESHINAALALSNAKRHQEAVEILKRAVEMNPKAAVAYNNLCAEYNSLGVWTVAEGHCKAALAIQPDYQLAKNNLDWSLKNNAAQEARLKDMNAKLKATKDPINSHKLLIDIGLIQYQQGHYAKAAETWTKIPADSVYYGKAHNNIASSNIVLKNFDVAEKSMAIALKLEPENQVYKNNKKWLDDSRSAVKSR